MKSFKLSSVGIILVLIVAAGESKPGPSQCWQFGVDTYNVWTNAGWQEAPPYYPDTSEIPYFPSSPTQFAWLQEQYAPPRDGYLLSPVFTMNDGDVVSATFYRHINELDGNDRINLTFITDAGSRVLLSTQNYDVFDTVSVTCSNSEIVCCESFPCEGQFKIIGEVVVGDELLAVSLVGINCPTPPPPPPPPTIAPPPPPPETCCDFDVSVCEWSLKYVSSGWHWSKYNMPKTPSPFTYFIWVEDASASVYSELINGVGDGTTFILTYNFFTSDSSTNFAEISFNNIRIGKLVANVGAGQFIYTCDNSLCCDPGISFCSGQFHIESSNAVGTSLSLSIDRFCYVNTVFD